ncbi:MAG: hypothetical protein K6F86_05125 [Lachnospiraceae bacterium]|nr:hypothetical protein [Lachnospiraceae bacterium]
MRITRGMMTNNSLNNINGNKTYLDKLNTQMATEKKLTRPSDDPIVAIRGLRLRASVSEVTQYFGESVPDAKSWTDVTQGAIESTVDILSTMRALCDQGANGTNDVTAREKIYQDLKSCMQQIYSNGNTTYAGRSVFTGFRTDEKLTFTENTTADYRDIVDTFNPEDVKKTSYIEGALTMDEITAMAAYDNDETTVKEDRVNRIRLSYDNLNIKTTTEEKTAIVPNKDYFVSETTGSGGEKVVETADGHTITITKSGSSVSVSVVPPASVTGGTGGTTIILGKMEVKVNNDMSLGVTKKYTMETGEATVTYREPLSSTPKTEIPEKSGSYVNPDTYTGKILEFSLIDGSDTIKIEFDNNASSPTAGKYITTSPNVISPVHQNTDGSFVITVKGQTYDNPPASSAVKIYNVSPDGKVVTSAYKESTIKATVTSSTSVVEQNASLDYITAYQKVALDPNDKNTSDPDAANKIYLLKDTGELVFGSSIAEKFSGLKSIPGVDVITAVYDKCDFEYGDPRPEHYFNCRLSEPGREIKYEADNVTESADSNPIIYDNHRQEIIYMVGTNQSIQINTAAEDVFDTQIAREVDDILRAITNYNAAEEKVMKIDSLAKGDKTYVMLDAANKELEIARSILQSVYEKGISSFKSFHDQANLSATACGTVDNRLTLISNRLQDEKLTVTTLASENEDVDITNIAVDVKEAELTYNAALLATGKIGQHSLMDYI